MTQALTRLLRASTRASVACLAALVVAAAPSCAPSKTGKALSFVERGELFATGTVVYDAWFRSVHDLQEEFAMLPIEERNHLVPLARSLDLLPSAEPALIVDRLARIKRDLPAVELVIGQPDEIDAKLIVPAGEKKDRGKAALLGSIETVANAELKAAMRAGDMPERARRLKDLGTTLAQNATKDLRDRPAGEVKTLIDEIKLALGVLDRLAAEAAVERDRKRSFVRGMREALKR